MSNRQQIFTDIVENNKWEYYKQNEDHSLSGEGSSLYFTENIRKELPNLFTRYNIKTIIDAPCGDFHWFKEINLDNYAYIGVDIVKSIIYHNNNIYKKSNITFEHIDLCETFIPKGDLIICRDCLLHLSDEDSFKILRNFKRSGSKYLLITTSYNNIYNTNITTGTFRHLNMQLEPFNFPEPLEIIKENNIIYEDKSLGLWKLEDLHIF